MCVDGSGKVRQSDARPSSVDSAPLIRVRLAIPEPLAFSEHWIFFFMPVSARLVNRFLLSVTLAYDSPVLCCLKDVFLALVLDVDVAHESLLTLES
jgi:hypothetical protein